MTGRAAHPVRLHPAHRPTGVVDDEQPRGIRLRWLLAEHDRGLGPQRQSRHLLELQRPVAAVAPDEVRDEVVGRVSQQVCRLRHLGEPATDAQHGHLVPELDGLVDVVGDEEDRLAELALQAQELVLQLLAHDGVDGRERLVHEHHRRVGREGSRHPDALLLAPRELGRVALAELGSQADALEQLGGDVAGALPVPAEQAGHGADVVEDGAVREEPGVLDDVADATPQLGLVHPAGVLAVEGDRAAGRLDHPVDHPQARRLAASRRPDEHGDLARWAR